jgi:outer membrane murein-binding lipoprotein Lpp
VNRKTPLVLAAVCLAVLAASPGCGSQARQYAQEARSSYITARAVLVGIAEFPAQMETLLRSESLENERDEAEILIEEARELLPSVSSAFRTVTEKAELLKEEGDEKFTPYAEKLLELVGLNEQIINAYSEFVGLSNSVLQGLPYGDNPQELMPSLNYMDTVILRIQELTAQVQQMEAEAEALYQEITK